MKKISLGFSTCPNDTFMFDAMVHGRVDTEGLEFEVEMADILHLNRRALDHGPDMVKVSYNTFGHVLNHYQLLHAGSALGRGCGPLLISREPISMEELLGSDPLVAIPGKNTTANMLLHFLAPGISRREEMLFHDVMPAVLEGRVDAGVIIHENRFTYQDLGLHCVADLGAHWEERTGLPIPLGAICAKRSLGPGTIAKLGRIMRRSVEYAFANREASRDYVRLHAQELSEEVTRSHIELYVNEFSIDLGEQGLSAVRRLLQAGCDMGQYPPSVIGSFDQSQSTTTT